MAEKPAVEEAPTDGVAAEDLGVKKKRSFWSPGFIMAAFAALLIGIVGGLGVYTFAYAKGLSYLSTDPAACINCHVMEEQYDSWVAGSHHNFATCSDCHMPHDNIFHKYYVKGENGFMHAFKFTTHNYPEHIVARDVSLAITNEACLYCHSDLTEDVRHPGGVSDSEVFDCARCHGDVGHE